METTRGRGSSDMYLHDSQLAVGLLLPSLTLLDACLLTQRVVRMAA